jgi:hypothetical protein
VPGPAISVSAAPLGGTPRLGQAWLALCAALALHVTDEALTGFLSVYNPTVLALRSRLGWWPMPTFQFREWLIGLIVLVCLLFLLSPLFFHGGRPIRPLAAVFAVLMIMNGMGHTLGTIAGRSVASVHFTRPMPGFWSSPFLIAASIWVLVELKRARV